MQHSRMNHGLRLAAFAVAGLGLGLLGACDSGGGDVPMIRATIKLQSITQQGECEATNIKVTPVALLPDAPKLSNNREFVTPVTLVKGADSVSCTGDASTIPMAPGKWKFTANLPSEIASCERDIVAGGNLVVNFKDGELTCS